MNQQVTVNVIVEINGKAYRTSNGVSVNGDVYDKDVYNLLNLGARQVIAEANLTSWKTEVPPVKDLGSLVAQDALVNED